MTHLARTVLAMALALAPLATLAQSVAPEVPAANRPEPPAPYDDDLARLAEILGSIHYLRRLCGKDEDQLWRDQMQALIEAEQPGPVRRARLVQSFNDGYYGFERTYRACNETARFMADRYMREGAELAQRVAARYGN